MGAHALPRVGRRPCVHEACVSGDCSGPQCQLDDRRRPALEKLRGRVHSVARAGVAPSLGPRHADSHIARVLSHVSQMAPPTRRVAEAHCDLDPECASLSALLDSSRGCAAACLHHSATPPRSGGCQRVASQHPRVLRPSRGSRRPSMVTSTAGCGRPRRSPTPWPGPCSSLRSTTRKWRCNQERRGPPQRPRRRWSPPTLPLVASASLHSTPLIFREDNGAMIRVFRIGDKPTYYA